jgi:predicted RNA-binding protein YlqC (UPF0109 family)
MQQTETNVKISENLRKAATVYCHMIVSQLVKKPDDLKIDPIIDHIGLNLIINADLKDKTLLIGYNGSGVKSLRKIMRIWGMKHNIGVNVFIPPSPERNK